MISKHIKEILFLPDYYTDEYNATPMKNYWPFLKELVDIINPKSVCEIGSERGLTSQLLGQKFRNIEKLHIVDPFINEDLKYNKPENMILHEETSLKFLKKNLEVEMYLIDGDHNYYTVYNELSGIEQNIQSKQRSFILLHDVSWMWARRDLYYNTTLIPQKFDSKKNVALNLETNEFTKYGFPSGEAYSIAVSENNPKNGVLTAIEDFIKNSELNWQFNYIPSLWGVGFLWLEDNFTENEINEIKSILNKLDSLKEFFGILEANRLRLLQGLNEWQGVAEERLEGLQKISAEREELYEIAEQRLSDLQKISAEREELYETAEQRLQIINKLKEHVLVKWFIKD